MADYPELQLVQEAKIAELLPDAAAGDRFEASGVMAKGGHYFVVFDDRTAVARLVDNLTVDPLNGLYGMARADIGYEGITYNAAKNRFYLLVEARKQKRGGYRGEIYEYDDALNYVKHRPLDFELASKNKGFEACCHVRREKQDYLLALCEGNKCKGGRAGRRPGHGRVQLFEKRKKRWSHVDTIKLPKALPFEDYSGMSIEAGRVAVVSQQNSLLWTGVFEEACWKWCDEGKLYRFPQTSRGIAYGNIEGVAWIAQDRLVTVSDLRKADQPDHHGAKDQSIHIFTVPH